MKQEIKPVQAVVLVVAALVLVIGLGYYFMFRGSGDSYTPLPTAHSRAEMMGNLHAGKAVGGNTAVQKRGKGEP